MPDIGGPPNRYYVVEPRGNWAGVFIEWLVSKKEDVEVPLGADNMVVGSEDELQSEDEKEPESEKETEMEKELDFEEDVEK